MESWKSEEEEEEEGKEGGWRDVLDVEEPPEVDARFVQLRRGSSIIA